MHRTMPASRGIEIINRVVVSGKRFYAALICVAFCRALGLDNNKPFLVCRHMLEMLAELSIQVRLRFTHGIEDH